MGEVDTSEPSFKGRRYHNQERRRPL